MAWSDDMRCLHCDGKLPLYRKITSGQFCSAVHRKAYWQDQERLAVERLHQTHDSLRAYRAPDALESILGKPAASEPVGMDRYYLAEQGGEPESQFSAEEIARSASNTGNVKFPGFLTEDKPALRAWDALLAAWDLEFAHWPLSAPSVPETADERQECTLPSAHGLTVPLFHAIGLAAQIRADAEKSGPVAFVTKPISNVPLAIAPETQEWSLPTEPTPVAVEPEEPPVPFSDQLLALSRIAAQSVPFRIGASDPEPLQLVGTARNARFDAAFATPAVASATRLELLTLTNAPRAMAAHAGAAGTARAGTLTEYSQPLELTAGAREPWRGLAIPAAGPQMHFAPATGESIFKSLGAAASLPNLQSFLSAQALELHSDTATPFKPLASRALELNLRSAPGCRYDVQSQPGAIHPFSSPLRAGAASELAVIPTAIKQLAGQALELSTGTALRCAYPVQSAAGVISPIGQAQPLAAASRFRIAPLPEGLGYSERHPGTAKKIPLAFAANACAPAPPHPVTTGVEQVYAANAPMHLAAKWEPLEGSATPPPRQGFLAAWSNTFANNGDKKHVWSHAAEFLQHAPRDLKLLAIAIPILLGLALRPSLPKVRVTAPKSTDGISRNIGDGFRQQFVNVRNTVAERAAVALNEDFRSGLDEWQSRGDLSSGWSFDGNGFVKPGTLALYRPSMGLTDYDMEFLGLIDKKALSWVVRAKDFDNYYVVKLVVTKGGPLPTVGITRYAVVDGKAQGRVDTVAPINARPDMLYRVSMNVHDDTFLLTLQGTVVDNWTEPRLKRGGVGFFAPRDEASRVRWIQVTHQYDMLGRLCAYLAPYNIPTTNGSW